MSLLKLLLAHVYGLNDLLEEGLHGLLFRQDYSPDLLFVLFVLLIHKEFPTLPGQLGSLFFVLITGTTSDELEQL